MTTFAKNWSTTPIFALICLAGFIASLTINYPGFMAYDSVIQILEARTGIYSDWHPPFMAFIWHFLNEVVPGPFGMLILQSALVWCGTFLIVVFYFDKTQHPLLALTPCLLVFYPPIFGISGAIWKDVLMWGLLTLAIGITGAIKPLSPVTAWSSATKLVAGSFILLVAILCRHNSVFAVLPLFALGAMRCIPAGSSRRYRTAAALIAALVFAVTFFASILINSALTTIKTNAWQQIAIFDIAGTIYGISDLEEQSRIYGLIPARFRGRGTLANLLQTYSPTDWVRMVRSADVDAYGVELWLGPANPAFEIATSAPAPTEKERHELMRLWINTALDHPVALLSHKLRVFRELIGLSEWIPHLPVVMGKQYPDWLGVKYGRTDQQLNGLQSTILRILTHLSWRFIFRPWLYLVLSALVILICLSFRSPERIQIMLIAASGFAIEAGLFLAAPAADYRYSHYMIYSSVLALLLCIKTMAPRMSLAGCVRGRDAHY